MSFGNCGWVLVLRKRICAQRKLWQMTLTLLLTFKEWPTPYEKKIGPFAMKSVSCWFFYFISSLLFWYDIWHWMLMLEWQFYDPKTLGKGIMSEYQCATFQVMQLFNIVEICGQQGRSVVWIILWLKAQCRITFKFWRKVSVHFRRLPSWGRYCG